MVTQQGKDEAMFKTQTARFRNSVLTLTLPFLNLGWAIKEMSYTVPVLKELPNVLKL